MSSRPAAGQPGLAGRRSRGRRRRRRSRPRGRAGARSADRCGPGRRRRAAGRRGGLRLAALGADPRRGGRRHRCSTSRSTSSTSREPDEPDGGRRRHAGAAAPEPPLTVVFSHGYALSLDSWHYQRKALRGPVPDGVLGPARPRPLRPPARTGPPPSTRSAATSSRVIEAVAPGGSARPRRALDGRHDDHVARAARTRSCSTSACSGSRSCRPAPAGSGQVDFGLPHLGGRRPAARRRARSGP